ncbi:MAG: radical SAM family heme chaperone HemW [Armatimonadetes bacterium]|nr:radical SAM family heme chaperone HemW [Armatimonadota bacterium]
MNSSPVAIYVHTPFCPTKCGYCDFNSYALSGDIIERTTAATIQEIRQSPWAGRPAKTIFFGGGTPTFLASDQLCRILAAVIETHPPTPDCEITSEANPGTVDAEKFAAMRAAGFNRLSLGAQSFSPDDLMRLGRVHAAGDVGKAVRAARSAGFDNLNLDLMFALPGQSTRAWKHNLDLALTLEPEHLSLYCLTIETNTRFYRHHLRGQLNLPHEDDQIAMYDLSVQTMAEAGLPQYEISNFAKPGRECRHNLCYWHGEEYASYGPGAVGRVGNRRYTNTKHPERYSEIIENGGSLACMEETVDDEMHSLEFLMMGMRLNQGISKHAVEVDPKGLRKIEALGWLEEDAVCYRLTQAGRHFCNQAIAELAP